MAARNVDPDKRRAEIAKAACKVILQKGFDGLRLKEVAAEMGYTTGVIQHYFRNKEALLLYVKTKLVDDKVKRMKGAALRQTGKQRLYAMAFELMPLAPRDVEIFQILSAFRGRAIGNRTLMDLQRRREQMGWDLFAEEVRKLKSAGKIAATVDAERVAVGLMAFIEGLALPLIMGSRMPDAETMTMLFNEYFEAVLGPLAPRAKSGNRGNAGGTSRTSPGSSRQQSRNV